MQREPLKIEELLNRMGSGEVPSDVAHRYALRRGLLCSRIFSMQFDRHEKWNRFMTFTIPLFAGGMLVVVFSFMGASLSEPGGPISVQTQGSPSMVASVQTIQPENQLSPYIDTTGIQPLYEEVKFAPVRTADYVMMR